MIFLKLAQTRSSIRKYTTETVEQEKLDYILECARLSPSAVNYQPLHFIVIRSEEGKQKIRECYNRQWFTTAPPLPASLQQSCRIASTTIRKETKRQERNFHRRNFLI